MSTQTYSYLARTRCVRQTSSGGVHKRRYTTAYVSKLKYTTAVINWHVRHARDTRASLGVLAHSRFMIAFMKTLGHANTKMLLDFPTRCVRQSNSSGVHSLVKYNWFYTGMHCTKKRCARISRRAGPFGLHDRFHESPRLCPRAPVSYRHVLGPCGNRAAVVHLMLSTPPVVYQAYMKYTTGGVISIILLSMCILYILLPVSPPIFS